MAGGGKSQDSDRDSGGIESFGAQPQHGRQKGRLPRQLSLGYGYSAPSIAASVQSCVISRASSCPRSTVTALKLKISAGFACPSFQKAPSTTV